MKLIIWGWILLLTAVEGFNITEKLVRKKREDIPGLLTITYEINSERKTVFLLRIASTLADPTTPTFFTKYDPFQFSPSQIRCEIRPLKYYLIPHKIERVGQSIFYHGVDSFSALTLFTYERTLHGVLDQKYYIDGLPLRDIGNIEIIKNYIHPISNDVVPRMKKMTDSVGNNVDDGMSVGNCGPNVNNMYKSNSLVKEILYPEILIGIDTLSPLPLNEDEFKSVYMYVLAYWNTVDMLFKNLKTVDIRINIAAIIMGSDSLSFPFIHENRGLVDKDGYNTVRKSKALTELGKHFYKFLDIIDRDSFDFLIFMTRSRLYDTYDREPDAAVVRIPSSCGGMRVKELTSKRITNRAMVVHDGKFAEYQTSARVLSMLMVRPDGGNNVIHNHGSCYNDGNPWGDCCEYQLRDYARSQYSCCLMNYPRSLPLTEPRMILSHVDQCRCYGMELPEENKLEKYDPILKVLYPVCKLPLQCKNEFGFNIDVMSKPLDGLPCESNYKYCHGGRCV